MPLMPFHLKLVLLPPWRPPAPCTPRRSGCMPAGHWLKASPLCDSSGLGRGQGWAFNRGLLSLALGTEMPPPTLATCRTRPPCTPHGSWLPRLGWTPSRGAHHQTLGEREGEPIHIPSVLALAAARTAKPTSLQGCVTTLGPVWRFLLALCQAHRVAAAQPRSAQGSLAAGLVLLGLLGNHCRAAVRGTTPPHLIVQGSWRSRACSCRQPALGSHQVGVGMRFQSVQPRQGSSQHCSLADPRA